MGSYMSFAYFLFYTFYFSNSIENTKPLLQDYYSAPPDGFAAHPIRPRSAEQLRYRLLAKIGGPVSCVEIHDKAFNAGFRTQFLQ